METLISNFLLIHSSENSRLQTGSDVEITATANDDDQVTWRLSRMRALFLCRRWRRHLANQSITTRVVVIR